MHRLIRTGAALALVFACAPAFGWQEVQILGDRATVTLDRDGSAVIRHEMQLRIRGGPVKMLLLDGLGTDAQILPDAAVRLARAPQAVWPLQVAIGADGNATMKVVAERGLRGGTYLVSLGYRARFEVGDEIQRGPKKTRITWVGPRFSSGIDSAVVTLIVPRGASEPTLPADAEFSGASPLLSQIRRGERDEVDLVRTHVARGEPAVWSVDLSPDALDGGGGEAAVLSPRPVRQGSAPSWTPAYSVGAIWSVLLALLTFGKARSLSRVTERLGLESWALFGGAPVVKALVTLALAAGTAWAGLSYRPTWAVALAIVTAANMVFLFPSRRRGVRGPGQWHLVPSATDRGRTRLEGGWFDVGRLGGFGVFGVLALGMAYLGYRELEVSSYRALLLLCGALLFLPLFFTGRSVDFPEAPLTQGRKWLSFLRRRMRGGKVRELELWGRYPLGVHELDKSEVDEARIRVRLGQRPPGLLALEVAFEEGGGRFVVPCVLVRAEEDSVSYRVLAAPGGWMRGPNPDERILVLRPSLPTPEQVLNLLDQVVLKMDSATLDSSDPSSSLKSSGRGAMTENAGPALQAM